MAPVEVDLIVGNREVFAQNRLTSGEIKTINFYPATITVMCDTAENRGGIILGGDHKDFVIAKMPNRQFEEIEVEIVNGDRVSFTGTETVIVHKKGDLSLFFRFDMSRVLRYAFTSNSSD